VHGRAGRLAAEEGPLIAGDLVRRLPATLALLRRAPAGRLGDSGT